MNGRDIGVGKRKEYQYYRRAPTFWKELLLPPLALLLLVSLGVALCFVLR